MVSLSLAASSIESGQTAWMCRIALLCSRSKNFPAIAMSTERINRNHPRWKCCQSSVNDSVTVRNNVKGRYWYYHGCEVVKVKIQISRKVNIIEDETGYGRMKKKESSFKHFVNCSLGSHIDSTSSVWKWHMKHSAVVLVSGHWSHLRRTLEKEAKVQTISFHLRSVSWWTQLLTAKTRWGLIKHLWANCCWKLAVSHCETGKNAHQHHCRQYFRNLEISHTHTWLILILYSLWHLH